MNKKQKTFPIIHYATRVYSECFVAPPLGAKLGGGAKFEL